MNTLRYCTVAVASALIALPALANHAAQELDEVIVSAPGDMTLKSTPHSVTVITRTDIEKASSSSLADLLSRQANMNLQSYFGTDKKTAIDMRGMGDTAGSNVLIMVDGVRRNEMDLSGADLSTMPLSQIERIEIVRGGGAVVYGNGAVAGVINIITKRGKSGEQSLTLEATRGSYGLKDNRLHATGSAGAFIGSINLSNMDTDGFRNNGGLRSDNASAELRFLPTGALDFLEVFARVATHYDEYGLPGPVSAADFNAGKRERRSTIFPNDKGVTNEKNYVLGFNADFAQAGQLKFQSSLRERINDYVIGYTPLLTYKEQESSIQSYSSNFLLQYDNDFRLFGMQEKITIGVDKLQGDYKRFEEGRYFPGLYRKAGEVYSSGSFGHLRVQPLDNLTLTGGYRQNQFSTHMNNEQYDCPAGCDYFVQSTQGGRWRNYGAEFGATWQPSDNWTLFASRTKHFRNPNVDELALAANDLRPQKGKTSEIGARYSPNKDLYISTTLFRMRNENEIYYDASAGLGVNRNYDIATMRKGLETEVRWKPFERLSLYGNVGYVFPRFEGTQADIPLVPRKTMSARIEWEALPDFVWSISGRYAGGSYDGNDFNNTLYNKLDSYTLVDTAVRYQFKKLELTAGINNLFNEVYTTRVYSQTFYPMPDRNGFVRLRLKF